MNNKLDREEQSSYNVLVQAYDNYQHGFTTGESRNSFIQLTVLVTDVNDEVPQFVEVNTQCSTISEFHQTNEPILNVRALDTDDPKSPNSDIVFTIRHGDEKGLFRMENVGRGTAKIYPLDSLKGHYGNYSLEIEAKDKGSPSNSETAMYNICGQVRLL